MEVRSLKNRPEPEWLTLPEALERAESAYDAGRAEIERALESAFRAEKIAVRGHCDTLPPNWIFRGVDGFLWVRAEIQWDINQIHVSLSKEKQIFTDVEVCRRDLELWLDERLKTAAFSYLPHAITDESDDANLKEVRRWFAERPNGGSEETENELAPVHPKQVPMAIAEVAATWLSECPSSRYEKSEIASKLFDLATDEQSGFNGGIFNKIREPLDIFDAGFHYHDLEEDSYAATKELFLLPDDLRHWCETPDGQVWCRRLGLPNRPKFLYGEQGPTEKDRPKVGAPAKYDWTEFAAEIVRIADMDGLPSPQSELEKIMEDWCETRWKIRPGESTIRERIAPIYRYLNQVGWKPGR